jgi:peptide/nickel transport system substrate-binding protein
VKRSHFLRLTTGAMLAGGMGRGASAFGAGGAPPDGVGTPALSYPPESYREQGPGKSGGTLRCSIQLDNNTLDPHATFTTAWEWMGRILYDNLIYLDEFGNPTPWLAKSWTISPDGKTYTFSLRDDVTFSDGAKFDAAALLANFNRIMSPAQKSPMGAAYIQPYQSGRIIDDYTFEATLNRPYAPFLNVLAQTFLAIISPKAIAEHPHQPATRPVGSGPFVLESYAPQQSMVFVKRADYNWSPPLTGHKGPAYLDRLNFDIVPDASVRYFSLASGEYDFTPDVPPQAAPAILASPAFSLTSRVRMGCPLRAIVFNVTSPPFDDVRVRRAAAIALNRAAITQICGFGVYRPIANFLAENTPFYDNSFESQLAYNPDEANRLLDAAGWTGRDADGYRVKDGKRLFVKLPYTPSSASVPMVAEIQQEWRQVGLDLLIEATPAGAVNDQRTRGLYQIINGGVFHTNTPDALFFNYHSSQISSPKRAGQNISRLADATLDKILLQARESNGNPPCH